MLKQQSEFHDDGLPKSAKELASAELAQRYQHAFYCNNCNRFNNRYLPKGSASTDHKIVCSNCGCTIQEV